MDNNSQRQLAAVMLKKKEPILGFLLVFIFGPLGYFYVSIMGGFIVLALYGLLAILSVLTLGLGFYLFPPLNVILAIWAVFSISSQNKKLLYYL